VKNLSAKIKGCTRNKYEALWRVNPVSPRRGKRCTVISGAGISARRPLPQGRAAISDAIGLLPGGNAAEPQSSS
jgi:hypothetical protein